MALAQERGHGVGLYKSAYEGVACEVALKTGGHFACQEGSVIAASQSQKDGGREKRFSRLLAIL